MIIVIKPPRFHLGVMSVVTRGLASCGVICWWFRGFVKTGTSLRLAYANSNPRAQAPIVSTKESLVNMASLCVFGLSGRIFSR